jgi:UDP-glucose 4-epimerase
MAAKYLVTGGAGFIGSHLAERLVKDGHHVTVFDDFSTGRFDNVAHLEGRNFRVVEGDVRDADAVKKVVKGRNFVLHHAALPSVARSVESPLETNQVNVDGTLAVLEAARSNKSTVKRVIYASSSSIYGDTPTLPKTETMPAQPMSPYAASKLAGEAYCRAYFLNYGIETVCLRYFNVFGPRQDPSSDYAAVVPKFVTALLGRGKPVIFGDGKQTRDFTYVSNVVDANVAACTAPKAPGATFNIACGSRVAIAGLANMIGDIIGTSREPRMKNPRPGDVRHSLADIAKAEDVLNYRVRVNLAEGLRVTVDWYRGDSG